MIDESRERSIASRFKLGYTGILGILVEVKSQGLIAQVKPLLDALVNEAGFWVVEPLYSRVLQLVSEVD
ncbi:MAG: DUF3368 domain-containing protein [Phormidium sp. SL48-SHIP]|nr:MAG: DUF3368 domain-containing protein [Phormidium sp. SL48-SHIP]